MEILKKEQELRKKLIEKVGKKIDSCYKLVIIEINNQKQNYKLKLLLDKLKLKKKQKVAKL